MKAKHFNLVLKPEIKNDFYVTYCYPDYVWENGHQSSEQRGWKLKTVCPSASFDETIVKIDGKEPPFDISLLEKSPIRVSFEDLSFTSYINPQTKMLTYQGHATGVKVLKTAKPDVTE